MSRYKGRLELEGEAHARAMAQLAAEFFPGVDMSDPEARAKLMEDPYYVDTLDGMTEFSPAVAAIVENFRRRTANAAGLRAQAEAYASGLIARAEREETAAAVIKARLERVMVAISQNNITDPAFSLSLRQYQPPVEVFDVSFLPDEYLHPPADRQPDKNKIREALNDPERREAVELAARFGNSPPSLQIKLK